MSRFRRIAASFAIVVVVYWAYALLVMPWVEPAAAVARPHPDGSEVCTNDPVDPPDDLIRPQMEWIKGLFPAGSWELNKPTILESNRAKLIFQEYRNHPDGRVEIHPCAVVFPYDGPAESEAQRLRQSVVLESPGGALLQFDPPLDLSRPKFGRLVGGQLVGAVTIRSDWKQTGPEDDLLIVTRDVQLADQAVFTPHPVDFRWGPHFGRGSDMMIRLLKGKPKPGVSAAGPNIAGIASFEMRHVERLHIDMGQAQPGKPVKQVRMPVEIQCRGPFRFDVLQRVATFRDGVNVMKLNAGGPADQLACDVLSLYFVGREQNQKAAAPAAKRASLDLIAQRLEARGNPVVVTAPSQNANARGPRIEYNLLTESITLDGAEDVFIQQGPNEIHASSLNYQSAGQGRLGRVMAIGPGWLRGQAADRSGRQLEAAWREHLRLAPDGQNQLVSLAGGAELRCPGVGQLQAREILFWLNELPPAAPGGTSRVQPDHMVARNGVRVNSPQLSGEIEQLEVRFEQQAPPGGCQTAGFGSQGGGYGSGAANQGVAGSPPSAPVGVTPVGMAVGAPAQPSQSQRFKVIGRTLLARVGLGGQQPSVSHLLIEDGVRFLEEPSGDPNVQRPLQIVGDRLELSDATAPNAVATVVGRPARCEARGMAITGSNIHLDRGANRMWIDGPGQMDLPLSAGTGQSATGSLAVTWQRGMGFDGQTATFSQSVVAVTAGQPAQQRLQTETMAVQLLRPISFSAPNSQPPPELEKIGCDGGVWMENRSYDAQGQPSTWDQLRVPNLTVNALNGQVRADGAGWLRSVRRGSANLGGGAGIVAGPADPNAQNQLSCLHVTFQTSITGTLPLQRPGTVGAPLLNLIFADHVRAAYAPVDRWEAAIPLNNPDKLGPQGMTARCDQLCVAETVVPGGNSRSGEVTALGNAVVEGMTFNARANRISYDSAKGMLVVEGDGRTNAELSYQLRPGDEANKHRARKISYWPRTHAIKDEGATSLDVGQMRLAPPGR